jgi:Periplasmic binding protein
MKSISKAVVVIGVAAALAAPALSAQAAAKPKANGKCRKVGEVVGTLTCTQKGKNRVYVAAAAVPVTAAPTTVAGSPTTAAPAAAGLANAPGFDGKTITIGYLGNVAASPQFPSSAFFADGGKALTAGFNAYISRVNDAGGVAGKYKINTLFKETYYDAGEATKAYTEIKEKVALFGQIYGPLMQALDKPLGQDNILGAPISLDAAWVRDANALPVGSTYQAQAINLIDYYLKEGGGAGKKVCSVALNSAYGIAGEEGYDFALAQLKFNGGVKLKWSSADAVVSALKNDKCDAVVATISGELHMPSLLSGGAKLDYFPTILALGPSFASKTVVPSNSDAYGKQVFVASDNSQWGEESVPGMKKHMDDLRKYAPEQINVPNPATTWGYTQAQTVVALLEKAVANGDLSRAGLKKAVNGIKVDTGGMFPEWTYGDPASRIAPASNFINKVDPATRGALAVIKPYSSAAAKAYK